MGDKQETTVHFWAIRLKGGGYLRGAGAKTAKVLELALAGRYDSKLWAMTMASYYPDAKVVRVTSRSRTVRLPPSNPTFRAEFKNGAWAIKRQP